MSNREAALRNAINRTTSFHGIEVKAKDDYKSLLVLNPHSYFKVIINGSYYIREDVEKEFTAVLDILNGDIFTVNFRGDENETASVSFKTYLLEDKHILFVKNINKIETLTVEYFDYFEIDTEKKIENMSSLIFPKEDQSCDFSGINIYHLKPIIADALSVRNSLFTSEITTNKLINVEKIKMGPWEFAYDKGEFSVSINYQAVTKSQSEGNLGDSDE